jgi:hypothetical protein
MSSGVGSPEPPRSEGSGFAGAGAGKFTEVERGEITPGVYERIGPTSEELTRKRKPDLSQPSPEHYCRYNEIDLLLPV